MKLTYANVMSTLAMFAATTTGAGYAAAQLGANSVNSRHIRNGQVTAADLHPSVRRALRQVATTPVPAPATSIAIPELLFFCANLDCPDTGGSKAGFNGDYAPTLPASGNTTFALSGTVTNAGNAAVGLSARIYSGTTLEAAQNPNSYVAICDLLESGGDLAPGASRAVTCTSQTIPVANAKHLRVQFTGEGLVINSTPNLAERITGNLRLEVKAAS